MNSTTTTSTTTSISIGVCISEHNALEPEAFALACGTDIAFVRVLVDEGLLQPTAAARAAERDAFDWRDWRFDGESITRVRRIRRLQHDFEANLQSVAVMLDLMQQVEHLRAELQRAGIEPR